MQRLTFLLLFLFSCVLNCFSQEPATFTFTHYGMVNGLASNEVLDIVQDRTGYLWIATNNGLQRYDGVHYKTFRQNANDPQSLPSNVIVKLFIDAQDNLWLMDNSGDIGLFNKTRFTYTSIPANTISKETLLYGHKRLIADEYGNVFLSIRGNQILIYNPKSRSFGPIKDFIDLGPLRGGITSLSPQPGTHKYWVGLESGGLAIYNRKTRKLSYTGHNIENERAIDEAGPKSDFAFSFFDNRGRVWFHQWGNGFPYCMQYDDSRNQAPLQKFEFMSTLKTYHELHRIVQQKDGRIWVSGLKLLAYFNEKENRFKIIPSDYRNNQGIVYEEVTSLYEDREKNMWVCTRNNGLYRFNPSRQFFTNIHHAARNGGTEPGNGGVMSFIQTKNGDLLTGTWEDGPFRYTSDLKNIPLGFKEVEKIGIPYWWSMAASNDSNTIWMANQPGIFKFDQAQNTIVYRNPPQLQNRTIRQLAEDKKGNLWLGMHALGVYRWINPRKFTQDSISKISEVGNAMINHLLIDKNGIVWVGSGNDGLFTFNSKSGKLLKHWKAGNSSEGNKLGSSIMSLLEYSDSIMLIANQTNLFLYNRFTNNLQQLSTSDALIGNIHGLQKDDKGFIWIATTNALYRIHPKLPGMLLFNRLDGITNDRFSLNASYKMKDGRMLFGTTNSFICFDPASIRVSDNPVQLVISGIQVGKSEMLVDSVLALKEMNLSYKNSSITIAFSALQFSSSQAVQYRMEGLDNEWKSAPKNFQATFSFLPPGKYKFHLRTLNADGREWGEGVYLPILITPPFWETWWFYTLMAIAVSLLLYYLDRQRMKRKERLQGMRTDIANGLHKEVNTALNNINILSEIARLKSDNEPQKAKEFMEQIHAKSHNMIIALDDMLWSLDPQNDTMDKTISRIREFIDAMTNRTGAEIELAIDKNVRGLELNMKLRHEAFLLFKEGLRSIVEAGTRRCLVHMALEKSKLLFTIEFDNEGCNRQQLNNLLHRRDIEGRLHALGAKLEVQVHKSKSIFMLQLPLA